jgi:hypothetical protein
MAKQLRMKSSVNKPPLEFQAITPLEVFQPWKAA